MTTTALADRQRQFEADGYVVVPDVLTPEECDSWSRMLDETWEREHAKPHTYDDEDGVRFVENLLLHSPLFQRCATDEAVLSMVRMMLGSGMQLSLLNYRSTAPGYGNQPLHGQRHPHGRLPKACDAIWCLDEFTAVNGTRVLPGTHMDDEADSASVTDPLAAHPDERIVQARRGSVLIFRACLIHASSTNRGTGPRRSILTQFVAAGITPRFNWSEEVPASIKRQLRPESLDPLGLS